MISTFKVVCSDILFVNVYVSTTNYIMPRSDDDDDMKVYSEHCTQNIVNNNKTQYKQAHLNIILQTTCLKGVNLNSITFVSIFP
jgi:hypothetical protein